MRKNEQGYISSLEGGVDFQDKLRSLGVYAGSHIIKRSNSGGHGPAQIEVLGSCLAIGSGMASKIKVKVKMHKLLLAGNPNVGKSVVFSRLTGIGVISSNYPGTTVDVSSGDSMIAGERFTIVDVPGAYSSHGLNKAEEVAAKIVKDTKEAVIINVVDATNLERNLFYTFELAQAGLPMVMLLNKWDIAVRQGITIDCALLGKKLGVTVIPFVATTGEGLNELQEFIKRFLDGAELLPNAQPQDPDERWKLIGKLSSECQVIRHKHASFTERLQAVTSQPNTGIPFAVLVMSVAFFIIRFIGEMLNVYVLDKLYNLLWFPFVSKIFSAVSDGGFIKTFFIGTGPDPLQTFGVLTTGIYIPFVTVLPYIFAFYFVLSILEDIGYLPRLAVLLDSTMHKFGIHGYGVIPIMLGLGCKVPAIIATRVLETKREQTLAAAFALSIAPCMPQTAMIFSLLAPYNIKYTIFAFASILIAGLSASFGLSRMIKGNTPELFVEIPPYQMPMLSVIMRKVYFRIKDFLFEAVPMIIFGIAIISLMDIAGIFRILDLLLAPFMHTMLGLPPETASVMLLGFLRKDVSISMLAPFHLDPSSIVVASVFLTLYLPCVGTFFTTLKELGGKYASLVFLINFAAAVFFSFLLHIVTTIF